MEARRIGGWKLKNRRMEPRSILGNYQSKTNSKIMHYNLKSMIM